MKNYKLIFSPEFVDGLKEVVQYIKQGNPNAAKVFERKVRNKIKLLKQFPEAGRASTDARLKGLRLFVIGNYIALYEVTAAEKAVYLHAFCHGARDYPNLYKNLPHE